MKKTIIEVTVIEKVQVTLDRTYGTDDALLTGHNLISVLGTNPYSWNAYSPLVTNTRRVEVAATVTDVEPAE